MVLQALAHLMPNRRLDPWEQQDILDVREAAAEWRAGRLPLEEAAKVGMIEWIGVPSPNYTRFLALAPLHPGHPDRDNLLAMADALLARRPDVTVTNVGVFNNMDLVMAGIRI